MSFSERICRIIALGLYDKLTAPRIPADIDNYVAAGNPGKTFHVFPKPIELPEHFVIGNKKWKKDDFVTLTVSGGSMLPDGIASGFELLTVPVSAFDVKTGDFIVINVDENFYKFRHNGLLPHFRFKLRRAIGIVQHDESPEQLCKNLEGTFAEALDEEERNDFYNSLAEARSFYGEEILFLSITYHDGDIHYSFHPSRNIKNKVEAVVYQEGSALTYKQATDLVA